MDDRIKVLFEDQKTAEATCLAAFEWMAKWRDSHNGYLPLPLFNSLLQLKNSTSTEIIVHKKVGDEYFFWLTMRNVAGDDPFNGQWHYPGGVSLYKEYELKTIARVAKKELGKNLTSCRLVKTIHPLFSARADIVCWLFLCEVDGDPQGKEEGRWFSSEEVMSLVPMAQNGIVPSHLVAIKIISDMLGHSVESPYLKKSTYGYTATNPHSGYSQEILVVDDITAEMVKSF